jgi:uncharacterized protein YkwD
MRPALFVCGLCLCAVASAARPARAEVSAWAAWSASPRGVDAGAPSALERAAIDACGAGDAGLVDTARAVLARKLHGQPLPEADDVAALQRAVGEPHPWAQAWAVSARALDAATVVPRLHEWLGADGRLRRCGAAEGASTDGTRVLVVVAVDALADLAPLPVRVRTGQWLTVEARLRVPASGGRVVVLGPSGAPRTVPSWFDGTTLRARFAPEGPGELTMQVVADLPRGPRPVLEATVFADVEPGAREPVRAAPGEDATAPGGDDEALAAMVTAARATASLPPLVRDPRLDAVARDHARRIARARELAHDAGDGDPAERLRAAGVEVRAAGENVAHAASLALAHRATWASPSHRANLLGAFARIGVAVVRDAKGDAWIAEELVR